MPKKGTLAGGKRPMHRGVTKRPGAYLVNSKDKGWLLVWDDALTGKRRSKRLDKSCKNAKERQDAAEAKSKELADERNRLAGIVPSGSDMAPSTVVEQHLATLTPNSRQSRQAPLRRVAAMLEQAGARSTMKVDRAMMARVRDVLARENRANGEPYAQSSRQFAISVTSTFWRWARKRGFASVSRDDIDDAHEGLRVDQEMVEVLQPAEVRQLLDVAIAHDERQTQHRMASPFLLGLVLSGCRPHELYGVEWRDVQPEAARLTIRAAGRKTGRARWVTFAESPTLDVLLEAVRRIRPPSRAPGPFGFSKNSVQRMVDRLRGYQCDDEGDELRLPDGFEVRKIRRTIASILATSPHHGAAVAALRGGHDIRTIQRHYLGHVLGVPKDATTIEAMLGIEAQVERVVELVQSR